MNKFFISTAFAVLISAPVFATNLAGDARITRELTAAAVADSIRNNCSSIGANLFIGMSKAMSLKSYAKGLGATNDEIDDFLSDSQQRARIMGLRNDYLKKNGVVSGNEASYCALGEREKSQGTLIGKLLT